MSTNTLQKLDLLWQLKTWKLNFVIAPFWVACILGAHFIGHNIIVLFGYPMYPGPFLSIISLIIINIIRSYSRNNNTIYTLIALGIIANLIFFGFSDLVNLFKHPQFDTYAHCYQSITTMSWTGYFGRMIGGILTILIDIYIFSYFFFKKGRTFFTSSIISNMIIVIIGSVLVSLLEFHSIYSDQLLLLTLTNLIRNIIVILIYTLISQPLIYWIHHRYLS